jgi:hypothetical protein
MLVASFASKQLGCENIIKAWGTLMKKLQGDFNSISMPKLLERGMGFKGIGYHHHPSKS